MLLKLQYQQNMAIGIFRIGIIQYIFSENCSIFRIGMIQYIFFRKWLIFSAQISVGLNWAFATTSYSQDILCEKSNCIFPEMPRQLQKCHLENCLLLSQGLDWGSGGGTPC